MMISHPTQSSIVTWAQWSKIRITQSLQLSIMNCWPSIWPGVRTTLWSVRPMAVYIRFWAAVIGILPPFYPEVD